MAIATEQIVVEIVPEIAELEAAIDALVRLGAIDQQVANGFKQTTTEINKQAAAVKNVGSATSNTSKNLDAVANSAKNVTNNFGQAFQKGVIGSLMEAGITLEDFEQQLSELGEGNIALAQLSKSLLEVIERIKQTGAELDALESGGQQGSEAFAKLEQQLNEDVVSLQKMTREIGVLKRATNVSPATASFTQLSKSLKDATAKAKETSAALTKLKEEGGEGTETFANLQAQLKADEEELNKINAALAALSDKEPPTIPPIVPPKENEKIVGVREELRELRAEIAQAIATNQNFGASFEALVARAGELDDAISDAGAAIKRTGSDTSTFDGLIAGAQGVAAGFAVAQGAAALFGDESEAMQKTLLKVNAAMAILQGLQQLAALREKESALALLISNTQRKISNAQTALGTALESKSIIVRGAATIAQKALNLAMAANPIGIVAVALAGLITLLSTYGRSAAAAARETSNLNVALGEGQDAIQRRGEAAQATGEAIIANLQTEGALQSTITRQEIENEKQQAEIEKQNLEDLRKLKAANTNADLEQRQALDKKISELEDNQTNRRIALNNKEAALRKTTSKEVLQDRVSSIEAELALATEGSRKQLDLQKKLIDARAEQEAAGEGLVQGQRKAIESKAQAEKIEAQKAFNRAQIEQQIKLTETRIQLAEVGSKQELEFQKKLLAGKAALDTTDAKSAEERRLIAEKLNADLLQLEADFQKAKIDLRVKATETALINVREGSEEELRLRKQLVADQAASELTNTRLSEDEKKAIRAKSLAEQVKLEVDFNKKLSAEALENQIKINEAAIKNLEDGNEEKLRLQLINIGLAEQQEIVSANGNAEKIKAINANRDADILAAKLAFIDAATQHEIEQQAVIEGVERRRLQKTIDERDHSGFDDRIAAAKRLSAIEIGEIDKLIEANEEKRKLDTANERKYTDEYNALSDQRKQKEEENADQILEIERERAAKTKEIIFASLQAVADVFASITEIQNAKDEEKIAGMKKTLQDEIDAGAISEKEAKARQKRIEIEEKKMQHKAAERNKQLALFGALINTAQAVTAALGQIPFTPANIVLAAIVGAMGLAQAALIASKPIPKFKTGKKHLYEGPGEVGEAGAEIIERNGTMYVVDKPTITWLGAKDKVYTPFETKQILKDKPSYRVNKEAMTPLNGKSDGWKEVKESIDNLQKIMKNKNGVTVNIDKEGITEFFEKTMSEIHYFNNRYTFRNK